MYWTDWGKKPYIRRATINGFNPLTIIETNLGWPNGLSVDMLESRIYWADAKTDRFLILFRFKSFLKAVVIIEKFFFLKININFFFF